MKIISHRAKGFGQMENSLEAFKEVAGSDLDGVELDVQALKTGELVVFHDEDLRRIFKLDLRLKDLSLRDLENLSLSYESKAVSIARLEDVLQVFRGRDKLLNIEIKNNLEDYPHIEEKVLGAISDFKTENILLSSFNHNSLDRLRRLEPRVRTGALYFSNIYDLSGYLNKLGAYSANPYYLALKDQEIEELKKANIRIFPFTVNNSAYIRKFKEIGLDGIITDNWEKVKKL